MLRKVSSQRFPQSRLNDCSHDEGSGQGRSGDIFFFHCIGSRQARFGDADRGLDPYPAHIRLPSGGRTIIPRAAGRAQDGETSLLGGVWPTAVSVRILDPRS